MSKSYASVVGTKHHKAINTSSKNTPPATQKQTKSLSFPKITVVGSQSKIAISFSGPESLTEPQTEQSTPIIPLTSVDPKPDFVKELRKCKSDISAIKRVLKEAPTNIIMNTGYQRELLKVLDTFDKECETGEKQKYKQREGVIVNILEQIDICSLTTKNSATLFNIDMLTRYAKHHLDIIKSKKAIIKSKTTEKRQDSLEIDHAEKALECLEKAYGLGIKSLSGFIPSDAYSSISEKIGDILTIIDDTISAIDDPMEQYNLLENSLSLRKKAIIDPIHLIDLQVKMFSYVYLFFKLYKDTNHTKFFEKAGEIMKQGHGKDAYNVLMDQLISQRTLTETSSCKLITVLDTEKQIASLLGDLGKAASIDIQIVQVKARTKEEKSKDKDETDILKYISIEPMKSPEPILKHGDTPQSYLSIKRAFQADLNKIQAKAEEGKWTDIKMFEWGVYGYLGNDFIASRLGELNSPENIKITLGLAFEAINIGCLKSGNLLCSRIFAENYPDVIQDTIKNHPEYFLDGSILRAVVSTSDLNSYAETLIGVKISKNDYSYNYDFEQNITPAIIDRMKSILSQVKTIAEKGDWNKSIESVFQTLYSSSVIEKALGNNLSEVGDTVNIARILILEQVIQSRTGDFNYNFVDNIIKNNPDLCPRVLRHHKDILGKDPFIRKLVVDIDKSISVADTSTLAKAAGSPVIIDTASKETEITKELASMFNAVDDEAGEEYIVDSMSAEKLPGQTTSDNDEY